MPHLTPSHNPTEVTPVSASASWNQIFTNLSAADSAGDQVSDFTSAQFSARSFTASDCTLIVPRLAYHKTTASITTQCRIVLWGRKQASGDNGWQVIRNKVDGLFVELTTNIGTGPGSDIKGTGDYAYTTPDIVNKAWDRQGCDEFFVLILQAFDGDATDATTALEIKVL